MRRWAQRATPAVCHPRGSFRPESIAVHVSEWAPGQTGLSGIGSVRRPGATGIGRRVVREVGLARAVRIHDINLTVAVSYARERDFAIGARESRMNNSRRR